MKLSFAVLMVALVSAINASFGAVPDGPIAHKHVSGKFSKAGRGCVLYWRGPAAEIWLRMSPFSMFALKQMVLDRDAHVSRAQYSMNGVHWVDTVPATCVRDVAALVPSVLISGQSE